MYTTGLDWTGLDWRGAGIGDCLEIWRRLHRQRLNKKIMTKRKKKHQPNTYTKVNKLECDKRTAGGTARAGGNKGVRLLLERVGRAIS